MNQDYQSMVQYYPLLVEAVVEFMRYTRELIARVKKKDYNESPSAHKIPLVDGYSLMYHTRHDKYYCLKQSEDFSS